MRCCAYIDDKARENVGALCYIITYGEAEEHLRERCLQCVSGIRLLQLKVERTAHILSNIKLRLINKSTTKCTSHLVENRYTHCN